MIFIYILIVGAAYEFGFYTFGCDTPSPGTKNVFRNFSQLESRTYEQRKRLSAHYNTRLCIFVPPPPPRTFCSAYYNEKGRGLYQIICTILSDDEEEEAGES